MAYPVPETAFLVPHSCSCLSLYNVPLKKPGTIHGPAKLSLSQLWLPLVQYWHSPTCGVLMTFAFFWLAKDGAW